MALALRPTASTSRTPPRTCTATTEGSSMMMPRPTTCTSVFAVPRSMAISSEKARVTPVIMAATARIPAPAPVPIGPGQALVADGAPYRLRTLTDSG
jgi:hypothetical protein